MTKLINMTPQQLAIHTAGYSKRLLAVEQLAKALSSGHRVHPAGIADFSQHDIFAHLCRADLFDVLNKAEGAGPTMLIVDARLAWDAGAGRSAARDVPPVSEKIGRYRVFYDSEPGVGASSTDVGTARAAAPLIKLLRIIRDQKTNFQDKPGSYAALEALAADLAGRKLVIDCTALANLFPADALLEAGLLSATYIVRMDDVHFYNLPEDLRRNVAHIEDADETALDLIGRYDELALADESRRSIVDCLLGRSPVLDLSHEPAAAALPVDLAAYLNTVIGECRLDPATRPAGSSEPDSGAAKQFAGKVAYRLPAPGSARDASSPRTTSARALGLRIKSRTNQENLIGARAALDNSVSPIAYIGQALAGKPTAAGTRIAQEKPPAPRALRRLWGRFTTFVGRLAATFQHSLFAPASGASRQA